MLYTFYGILLMVVVLPILQAITGFVVTLFDYWTTIIAAETTRITNQLEREGMEMQIEMQEKQLEGKERPPAIGFQCFDTEAYEMEDDNT